MPADNVEKVIRRAANNPEGEDVDAMANTGVGSAPRAGQKSPRRSDKQPLAESVDTDQELNTDVILISMPFDSPFQPSIALGLLKAALTPLNVSSKTLYFTLHFAELIGTSLYSRIQYLNPIHDLVGEWLFAEALFEPSTLDARGYIEDVLHGRSPAHRDIPVDIPLPESYIQQLVDVRSRVGSFLDNCLAEVISYNPKIVGFTSVYQQQVASLALAERIKQRAPDTLIIFGGANCEGVMGAEVIRQFPFVDAVVSGEGDIVFPEMVQRILTGKSLSNLQGVYTRDGTGFENINGQFLNTPSITDMDALPVPDYDDFFDQLKASHPDKHYQPRIMFETSRGCWWGEHSHCTFCGLNDAIKAYRGKSSSRALDELVHLTDKYPNCPVVGVDWILNMKYFKDFIPELAARQMNLEMFYEVKANLKKEQLRLLRDAGIKVIQPGIESFSDQVLGLMRKGVRGLQNIQLLKWCKELGVQPQWNILWGFPGEDPEEYVRMAEVIPLLTHLSPPQWAGAIRLDRFSPNFDYADQQGFVDVKPYPAYHYVYPFAPEIMANLAYFFTYGYREAQDVSGYTLPVYEATAAWKASHEQSVLFSIDTDILLFICDLRPIAHEPLSVLTGIHRSLYLACDCASSLSTLHQLVEDQSGGPLSITETEALLKPLVDYGLMVQRGNMYLSLAIPVGEYSPGKFALERFKDLVREYGQVNTDKAAIRHES